MVEPNSDLGPGPDCMLTDFVDHETAILFNFLITELVVQNANGKKCSNAKSYSILIDTDGKFGGTGPNNPDHSSLNPGFVKLC
jgi:hypothetical protein